MPVLSPAEYNNALRVITSALAEDLGEAGDLTSQALVDPRAIATIHVVVREPGVVAGLPLGKVVFRELDADVSFVQKCEDGTFVGAASIVAEVTGSVQSLLTGERTALNCITHLSGIATVTNRFVEAVEGTKAVILDTRKTLPGYRLLHKYAVRCGGGTNHRLGLFDGVLIKDNHLAAWSSTHGISTVGHAVQVTRRNCRDSGIDVPIEVEVDTLKQLTEAFAGAPDIVLLDNMLPEQLHEAVRMRDEHCPTAQLEASGGITLENVRLIANTGVDRISVGALTHSAPSLDVGFDWSLDATSQV